MGEKSSNENKPKIWIRTNDTTASLGEQLDSTSPSSPLYDILETAPLTQGREKGKATVQPRATVHDRTSSQNIEFPLSTHTPPSEPSVLHSPQPLKVHLPLENAPDEQKDEDELLFFSQDILKEDRSTGKDFKTIDEDQHNADSQIHAELEENQHSDPTREDYLVPVSEEYLLMRAKEYLDVMTIGFTKLYQELKITKQKHQVLKEDVNKIQNLVQTHQKGECQRSNSAASVAIRSESSFEWPENVTGAQTLIDTGSLSTMARDPSESCLSNGTSMRAKAGKLKVDE
jgi:hypothetical protein